MLVDSHAHLEAIDYLEWVIKRAKKNGVGKIVTIGTSIDSSKKAIEIADSTSSVRLHSGLRGAKENFPEIYATVGLHPKDAKKDLEKLGIEQAIQLIREIAQS